MVHIVKVMFFPIGMYRCEWGTIKKTEGWRTDAFQLWYWRRLLKVPWKARRSNQSISRFINPEYSLEGLMLKLKLQYFGHLMWTADSLKKTLMLGKIEGRRKEGKEDEIFGWHHWFNGHEFGQTLGDSGGQGGLAIAVVHEVAKSQKQLGNWMTTTVHPLSHKIRADWSFMRQSTQVRKKKKTTTGASTCLPL